MNNNSISNYLNYEIAGITLVIVLLFFKFDIYSAIALSLFMYWVSSLFIRTNDSLPIKELFLSLYGLQFLFGPALAYNGMDYYTLDIYKMKVNSEEYFSFLIPVFIAFSLGFNVYCKKYSLKINRQQIDKWCMQNPKIPYYFIVIGFITSYTFSFLPSSLVFLAYLMGSFKYIGLFILLLSYKTLKIKLMALIYGLILVSSFQSGMFHDLLTWIIVLCLILAYRYKPTWQLKLAGILIFVLFAIFIQSIKQGLRAQTWINNKEASVELVKEVTADANRSNGGWLSLKNLGPNFVRINQGWVLASTMDNVPRNVAHSNGLLLQQYLYSAFIPRFIDDTKLASGGKEIFNIYSGHHIDSGTSIALGLFTDAYVDSDSLAVLYVFLFGLFYGYILHQFNNKTKRYPILILFALMVIIYPVRPDCETQTALGHIVKSIMLLTLLFTVYRKKFMVLPKIKSRAFVA